jgi:DNA-binding transcriptional MerR regulator
LDKAPDAFRTISEVADDLDIPQHVLRFWETRFTQIKPMKRSGGRRYYRPDDVDLLRGIRRLLYGEGYTIRGVQRILKEHGIKSVQGLIEGSSSTPSFGTIDEAALRGPPDEVAEIDAGDDEDEVREAPVAVRRAPEFASPPRQGSAAVPPPPRKLDTARLDTARLETALQELVTCRQLLDLALKDG